MNLEIALQPVPPLSEFLRSPINWLLIFVPVTLILERVEGAPAPLIFFSAGIAIIPIAAVMDTQKSPEL